MSIPTQKPVTPSTAANNIVKNLRTDILLSWSSPLFVNQVAQTHSLIRAMCDVKVYFYLKKQAFHAKGSLLFALLYVLNRECFFLQHKIRRQTSEMVKLS